jgi:hypothetical protein
MCSTISKPEAVQFEPARPRQSGASPDFEAAGSAFGSRGRAEQDVLRFRHTRESTWIKLLMVMVIWTLEDSASSDAASAVMMGDVWM